MTSESCEPTPSLQAVRGEDTVGSREKSRRDERGCVVFLPYKPSSTRFGIFFAIVVRWQHMAPFFLSMGATAKHSQGSAQGLTPPLRLHRTWPLSRRCPPAVTRRATGAEEKSSADKEVNTCGRGVVLGWFCT